LTAGAASMPPYRLLTCSSATTAPEVDAAAWGCAGAGVGAVLTRE